MKLPTADAMKLFKKNLDSSKYWFILLKTKHIISDVESVCEVGVVRPAFFIGF